MLEKGPRWVKPELSVWSILPQVSWGGDGGQEVCIWVAPAGELQREKHREENALREEAESGRHCLTPGPPAIEKGLAGKEAAMGPAGKRGSIRAGSAEGRHLLLLMVVFLAPGTLRGTQQVLPQPF